MKLIKQNYCKIDIISSNVDMLIGEFKDCFDICCINVGKCHIELRDDVKPVVSPTQIIPISIKSKLNEEIQRMEKMGVIEKIDKPKPNGKLRICIDPRPLKKAIKREYYQLPTAKEIVSRMKNARFFYQIGRIFMILSD